MYLDFSKLKFNAENQVEQPVLRLQTLAGKELGTIPDVYDLEFDIEYADLSTIEFDVPYYRNGSINPRYTQLTGYKQIYTDTMGVYVLMSPSIEGDGLEETKHVTGYSLEYLFERKRLYLEEGTYNFWNPASTTDTILSRILELDPSWSVGTVDTKFIGCYRTFDEYNDNALNFCYNDASEKFGCVFVFDTYNKTINVYDAYSSRGSLPIYLDYKNLVEEVGVDELSDEIITKLYVYGSDSLSIRDVNPIGTAYMIDLSYFIANGDLNIYIDGSDTTMGEKVELWTAEVIANQTYYSGLIAAKASKTAEKIAANAALTDLEGELDTLTGQQTVTIQALALETTDDGIAYQEALLEEYYEKIVAKTAEIEAKEAEIEEMQAEIDEYTEAISAVVGEYSFSSYFTENEILALTPYLIEDTLTEETFVATDVSGTVTGDTTPISGTLTVTDSAISQIDLTEDYGKYMYTLSGGSLSVSDIEATIVRGTVEVKTSEKTVVMSAYLGDITYNETTYSSGMLTMTGDYSSLTSDIAAVTEDEVTTYEGTELSIVVTDANAFFTVNVSDYQRYSVEMELYEFGVEALEEKAWPVYEFSIDSGNFLFLEAFAPFRDVLELGKEIHLNLGSEGVLSANLIGLEFDFEDKDTLKLTFSNQYQKKNGAQSLYDILQTTYSSSVSFDAAKYIYNLAANQAGEVATYMSSTLDAALQTILAAADQSVEIGAAGIQVSGTGEYSNYQIRIVDNMIAMTEDNWQTASLAIGLFSTEGGNVYGVNAGLLAGNLIIGETMILENPQVDENGVTTGVMQFKVDSTGAWLYNATFILQSDSGGNIILAPDYGIAAGTSTLFTTSGTTVTPSFIDSSGNITFDSDGMPTNANFFLDLTDGSAYLRGTVCADAGYIGGWTLDGSMLYAGEGDGNYVALNGSGTNTYSDYAIWAGGSTASTAPFWVKKDGSMSATNGTFSGTLKASKLAGALVADETSDEEAWLEGCGIKVGANNSATKKYNFYVDPDGNVWMEGNIHLGGNLYLDDGVITWDSLDSSVTNVIEDLQDSIDSIDVSDDIEKKLKNSYGITYTTVGQSYIESPEIYTGDLYACNLYASSDNLKAYSNMSGYGFSTYYKNISSSYYQKAFIGMSSTVAADALPTDDDDGLRPTLRLGAGSGNQNYIFIIQKDGYRSTSAYDHTAALGLTGGSGTVVCGFEFNASTKTINVIGTLSGVSGSSSTATFA